MKQYASLPQQHRFMTVIALYILELKADSFEVSSKPLIAEIRVTDGSSPLLEAPSDGFCNRSYGRKLLHVSVTFLSGRRLPCALWYCTENCPIRRITSFGPNLRTASAKSFSAREDDEP